MQDLQIAPIAAGEDATSALVAMHIEAVAENAGMSFMHPLAPDKARAYWREALGRAQAGKQIVLGAYDAQGLAGTVTLVLDMPENQPHRGEIVKMMVAARARRQGIAGRLLVAAEATARKHGRTLLMLDTVKDSAAAKLYARLGRVHFGDVPGHALRPHGGLGITAFYYKQLG